MVTTVARRRVNKQMRQQKQNTKPIIKKMAIIDNVVSLDVASIGISLHLVPQSSVGYDIGACTLAISSSIRINDATRCTRGSRNLNRVSNLKVKRRIIN